MYLVPLDLNESHVTIKLGEKRCLASFYWVVEKLKT